MKVDYPFKLPPSCSYQTNKQTSTTAEFTTTNLLNLHVAHVPYSFSLDSQNMVYIEAFLSMNINAQHIVQTLSLRANCLAEFQIFILTDSDSTEPVLFIDGESDGALDDLWLVQSSSLSPSDGDCKKKNMENVMEKIYKLVEHNLHYTCKLEWMFTSLHQRKSQATELIHK